LIEISEVIAPYNRVMDEARAKELAVSVVKKIENYDYIVYFQGGARKVYLSCLESACYAAKKPLIIFGYANMGGINMTHIILEALSENRLDRLSTIEHLKINLNSKILH